ncbi:MAG: energy transducer TonB [Bacteroidales bacterium]|nr:energy transducer TonB [Bacteroidales bacterium]
MRRLSKEDKAGIYTTVIVHLAVVIVLLLAGLDYSIRQESSFVLDFSKLEELERQQEEAEKLQEAADFQESIARKIDARIQAAPAVRGVAVDRAALKDDRGTDAEQLYKDAQRLQEELARGYEVPQEDVADPGTVTPQEKEETATQPTPVYSGPSVVSYFLEGRKASHLPIPAYRCMGAGQVTVLITVNPSGAVVAAKVDESASSKDGCLRSFAIRAARLSKFSAKADAPAKQQGNIVYEFVSQY